MLEHGGLISVKIICNRGLTHELVRHRLASYAQESTRFVNYSKDKQNSEIKVILPLDFYNIFYIYSEALEIEDILPKNDEELGFYIWLNAMRNAEKSYMELIDFGLKPQIARGVLPIDVKTEIIISANPTEWLHIFRLRTDKTAHPQIRTLMRQILAEFKKQIPVIFNDITF
jgi:thymidylate synthase (FAD)